MNKQQEFRKQTEEAKLEAFSLMCRKVADLEKENAELKERLKEHESIGNAQFWENVWSWKTKSDQLTKAKELLERLLITSCNSDVLNLLPNCSEVLRVRVEAEQFLSEVEDKGNV